MSDFLWPHGLQLTRPPCPSPTPGVYSNPWSLSTACGASIRLRMHMEGGFWDRSSRVGASASWVMSWPSGTCRAKWRQRRWLASAWPSWACSNAVPRISVTPFFLLTQRETSSQKLSIYDFVHHVLGISICASNSQLLLLVEGLVGRKEHWN